MQKIRNANVQIRVSNSSINYVTDNKTYQKQFFISLYFNSATNSEAYKFLLKTFSALWNCFDKHSTNYSTRELGTSNIFTSGWWKGKISLNYCFSQWSLERYYTLVDSAFIFTPTNPSHSRFIWHDANKCKHFRSKLLLTRFFSSFGLLF